MRIKKSLRNVVVTIILQIISILVSFFTRQYFVNSLGTSYLGLNGLFDNVLSMLSLAELGFSTAIMFFLFKPIAEDDQPQIKILIKYFKNVYNCVGIFIFIIGIFIIPILQVFIKTDFNFREVVVYYIVYLAATSVTYMFSYKKTLLIAYQDKYITSIITYTVFVVLNLCQVFILSYTKNYFFFLVAMLIFNLIEGLLVNFITNKIYPFIKEKTKDSISKGQKTEILKNVKALFMHRIGGVVINGTDNLVIAAYVGLSEVGIYSNYYLIINAINIIIGQVFAGITASVGNLSITDDKKRFFGIYNIGLYINALIYVTSTIVLWFIMSDFIKVWVGTQYVMSNVVVIIILAIFLINGMRWMTKTYRDTLGLYWYDRYKPIFESIINLLISVILAQKIGIAGVFIGTLAALILTSFWVEPYILYKYGFGIKLREYFKKYTFYCLIGFICFVAVNTVNNLIYLKVSLLTLIGKGILYSIMIISIFVLATLRTDEFVGIKQILFEVILGKRRN
jgi:O-antigen/teichoic acid export membrane protein